MRFSHKLRAGIIGCGRIGSGLDDPWFDEHVADESWRVRPCTHAGQYYAHPDIELVAGAELDPARRAAFAHRWGIERVYADYQAMLDRENLDIVSIATRGSDHYRPTVDAARAGVKVVFLEKHIASSLAEADEMVETCVTFGTRLVINHPMRFDPAVQTAVQLVQSGAIGELRTIVCYFSGRVVHTGSHFFDLFRLFADEARAVFARLEGDEPGEANASLYVEFDNGVRALVDARPRMAAAYLEFLGDDGMIRYCNDVDSTWELWQPTREGEPFEVYYQRRLVREPFPKVDPELDRLGSIRRGRNVTRLAVDEVVACAREGRESTSSGREGRAALEIIVAAYESHARSGCLVQLPLQDRTRHIEAI